MNCIYCGKEITDKREGAKYCSSLCQSRANQGVEVRTLNCAVCGKEFETARMSAKYCSEFCRTAATNERNRKKYKANKQGVSYKTPVAKICVECGNEFTTTSASKIVCSTECRKTRRTRYEREWARQNYKSTKPTKPKAKKAKPEPTVASSCPKDCHYRGWIGGTPCCDYILVEGNPRPCGIGKNCTVYVKKKRTQKKNQIVIAPRSESSEIKSYKIESSNRYVGNEHRKGNSNR